MPMSEFLTKSEHKEFVDHMKDEHANMNRRIDKLEKLFDKLNALVVSVEKLATGVSGMQEELKKQGVKLEEIEKQPTKNWNTAKTALITGIITAAIGLVVGALGF